MDKWLELDNALYVLDSWDGLIIRRITT